MELTTAFKDKRLTFHDMCAEIVTALAKRSTCTRLAVGALLYDSKGHIISTGYNGTPFGYPHCIDVGCSLDNDGHCINTIHAEENVLLQCAVIGRSTERLNLFTTHFPCWRCGLRLMQTGIRRIIYMNAYGSDMPKTIELFHRYEIGILQYRIDII